MKNYTGSRRGLFRLEVLLSSVIVLFVITGVVVRYSQSKPTSKRWLHAHNQSLIGAVVERYHLEQGHWPSVDLHELDHEDYFSKGLPKDPFGNDAAYRFDNQTGQVFLKANQ